MPEYTVGIREVWVQTVRVTADTPQEAVRIAQDSTADDKMETFEYSHRLPGFYWHVEDEYGKVVL